MDCLSTDPMYRCAADALCSKCLRAQLATLRGEPTLRELADIVAAMLEREDSRELSASNARYALSEGGD